MFTADLPHDLVHLSFQLLVFSDVTPTWYSDLYQHALGHELGVLIKEPVELSQFMRYSPHVVQPVHPQNDLPVAELFLKDQNLFLHLVTS